MYVLQALVINTLWKPDLYSNNLPGLLLVIPGYFKIRTRTFWAFHSFIHSFLNKLIYVLDLWKNFSEFVVLG